MAVLKLSKSPQVHREWGLRPFVTPHAHARPGCSYTLEQWPHKIQEKPSWWTVFAFVDEFGEIWAVTSH